MTQEGLQFLLEAVAAGEVSPETALEKLKHFDFEPVGDFARIDHHRSLRTGFPEVIWGADKTPDQILQIMQAMRDRHPVVMATRITPEVYAQLQVQIPSLHYYPMARICALIRSSEVQEFRSSEVGAQSIAPVQKSETIAPSPPHPLTPSLPSPQPGTIGIISAGTADLPVAEEAAVTAELCGFQVQRLWDVGVAGIHRLLSHRQLLSESDVLIVVAGMEGALPSVVAGLADCPTIAVPTSVGYGASFGGLAPLLTMLNSCAAGVGVVNIDNGFGAAILAGQILRTANKVRNRSKI
ncbi:MAG: nickel pincer cofactor biosynthesis protein LarB [Cyanosarcina radialis HA8281-LM2]|jgi:hypothetical protein|nr:nickel pincer cofactor biosynthesis protein LarB [Cyanosarcina radialis HA8281-LM2]